MDKHLVLDDEQPMSQAERAASWRVKVNSLTVAERPRRSTTNPAYHRSTAITTLTVSVSARSFTLNQQQRFTATDIAANRRQLVLTSRQLPRSGHSAPRPFVELGSMRIPDVTVDY